MPELQIWPREWPRPWGSSLKQRFVFFASQNFLLPEVPGKVVVQEASVSVKYSWWKIRVLEMQGSLLREEFLIRRPVGELHLLLVGTEVVWGLRVVSSVI